MSAVHTAWPAGTNDEAPAGGGRVLQWIIFVPHGDESRPVVATVSGTSIDAVIVGKVAGITGAAARKLSQRTLLHRQASDRRVAKKSAKTRHIPWAASFYRPPFSPRNVP